MTVYFSRNRMRWRLDMTMDGKRFCVSGTEKQPLERLGSIIKANRMPYDTAKGLAQAYKRGEITGYVGHKYLYSGVAYRLIFCYKNGDGFICKFFNTPEEAWQDRRIQERLANLVDPQVYDYDSYLKEIESKGRWTLSGMTILHSSITRKGNILPVRR